MNFTTFLFFNSLIFIFFGKLFLPTPTTHTSLPTADVSPLSSPLRDVSRGGTSATQRQEFHTDDVNQCLHNKSGSHGAPNANLFNFTFLLVDFGKSVVFICE